jgi:hypothetical protein
MYTKQQGSAVWWLIGLIALAVIAFFVFRHKGTDFQNNQPNGMVNGETAANNQKVVLEGQVVCLPHRNTTGPTTMECAYGLKADDGKYYGLDNTGLPSTTPPEYDVGDRLSVEGTLVPQDQIPSNFWQTYNVSGLMAMEAFWKFTEK